MIARIRMLRDRVAQSPYARPEWLGMALFWGWNLVFLAFMTLGFAPNVLPDMLRAVRDGDMPTTFLAYALVLTSIPAAAVLLALTWFRTAPQRLFALGYGVEGPLMLVVAVRFFVIRELTPAAGVMLGLAGLGLAAFLWTLMDRGRDAHGSVAVAVRLVGLSLLLLVGLYAAVWITFYTVPLVAEAARALWVDVLGNLRQLVDDFLRTLRDFDWRSLAAWRMVPFAVLGTALAALTGALFVAMPVVIAVLYVRAWSAALRAAAARFGRRVAVATTVATLAAAVAGVVAADRQPQAAAFARLAEPPATLDAARALARDEADLRAGLVNAYLARYRYFSAAGEVMHIRDLYARGALDLAPANAERLGRAYEAWVRPLLYRPVRAAERPGAPRWRRVDNTAFVVDAARAAELYQRYFDAPIDRAERPALVAAVGATWMAEQAVAERLQVDDREVYLERQAVTVAEHGDWAEVELHEVYRNRTTRRQEVVYHFSLPESAVVTGVWLGGSEDRAARFAHRVAPRGAAQQLYREEVRRRVDPALVEQIGPRQYRLRVFPVEPRRWDFGADGRRMQAVDGPPLHLWLTWRVLAADGAWPLPRLGELRNVYWDARTVRTVDGAVRAGDDPEWLPATAPAGGPIVPAAHRVDVGDGQTVIARPVAADDTWPLAPGTRLAVVLDRSRSMQGRAGAVAAALADLRARAAAGAVAVDVYLTAAAFRGEAPTVTTLDTVDAAGMLFFGGQHPVELLAQLAQLRGGRTYDASLVLTDDASFSAPPDGSTVAAPPEPVWLVHLGGAFPPGYDDATLEAVQASGGGVAGNVDEALTRLAAGRVPLPTTAATTAADDVVRATSATLPEVGRGDVVDGYRWSVVRTEDLARLGAATGTAVALAAPLADVRALADEPGFAPLAARRVILAALQAAGGDVDRLASLDRLHALAVEQSVVTPYSSMIVLVDDVQARRLDELEGKADRFAREVEGVGETETPLAVTGVPEPEAWLLLALAAAMLAVKARQRVRTASRGEA